MPGEKRKPREGTPSDATPIFKTPSNEGKRRRLRSRVQKTPSLDSSEEFTPPIMRAGSETPGAKERAMLSIPASPCLQRLGYGTGVNVFLYQRSPRSGGAARSPWAIKKFNVKKANLHTKDTIAERLDEEAAVLRQLKHPNIIGFRGYRRDADGNRVLAVENGERSLFDLIEDMEPGEVFPAEVIERVITAAASALNYLHKEKHLLHGDLKSGNILIIGDFEEIKVCDFGVTLPLRDDLKVVADKSNDYVGTGPWVAKEAMGSDEGVPDVSDKTDMFALGCVIFEMLALRTPHTDLLPDMDEEEEEDEDESFEFDDSEYQAALGTRPALPKELTEGLDDSYLRVLSLFYACTEANPEKRPSAAKILETINEKEDKKEKRSPVKLETSTNIYGYYL